jgi:glycosyltransferase involved in cell wall biosynthesis
VVDVYKHQWNVVEAVSQLRKKDIPIVLDIVGPAYGPALRKLTKALNVWDADRSFVRCHGNIAHTELHHLFHKSDGFIFASTCENFPNTLLEAMASGLPIACSNRRPMTDIVGDSCVLFDPLLPQSISEAINMMIVDISLRDRISKSVYEMASDYSWEKCSDRTFNFVDECAVA